MYKIDGPMECIQSMLYPVHDAENKLYIMPPDGVIVTSDTQKLILSETVGTILKMAFLSHLIRWHLGTFTI